MARKTKVQQAAEAAGAAAAAAAIAAGGDQEIELEGSEAADADVLRALAELDEDNDVEWSVSKMDGSPDQRGFIEKITSSQLDRQRFRDLYGPGKYRVAGRKNGQFFTGSTRTIQISSVGYKAPTPAAAAPVTQPLTIESVQQLIAAQKAQGLTPDKILPYLPLLVPLGTKLIERMFAPAPTLADQLATLKHLQDLEPKERGLAGQLDEVAGIMVKLRDLSGDNGGGGGTTWLDLALRAIDALKEPLGTAAKVLLPAVGGRPLLPSGASPTSTAAPSSTPAIARGPTSASPPASAPGPANGSHSPSPAPAESSAVPLSPLTFLTWFRAVLEETLIPKARADANPELYAELVLDNLPEGVTPGDLLPLLERPNWWSELQTIAPNVARYPRWFGEFRRLLIQWIKSPPEATDDTTAEPPAGDGSGGSASSEGTGHDGI